MRQRYIVHLHFKRYISCRDIISEENQHTKYIVMRAVIRMTRNNVWLSIAELKKRNHASTAHARLNLISSGEREKGRGR